MTDELKKYLLVDRSTRVQAVRLSDAWQSGLAHQDLPDSVRDLLGELLAAATLLAANLKFKGSLVLQLQGDGPVALLVVECTADLKVRATATLRDNHPLPEHATLQTLLNANGQGRFIVVLDPEQSQETGQTYQGIVALDGDTVAEVLELYMANSEQLQTRLQLAANGEECAGLLLQRLPERGGFEPDTPESDTLDTWETAQQLLQTVKADELLSTDTDTLIHRLFWQQDLLVFEPQTVRWHCPCTRKRVTDMLRMLGEQEVQDILTEQGRIDVHCHFCGKPYTLDAVDCAALFVDVVPSASSGSSSLH